MTKPNIGNGTILPYDGRYPKIASTAYICRGAYVIGDVEIGDYTVVHPGTVLRGDGGKLIIGKWSLFQDNVVVHCNWHGIDVVIEDHFNASLGAIVHAFGIGEGSFIGAAAVVANGVYLGKRCFVAAGAVVPQDLKAPSNSILIGVPARIKENDDAERLLSRFGDTLAITPQQKEFRLKQLEVYRREGH